MAIIISKNGKNAEKLDQSNFELEDKLQEYIYENPDTIPLYEIDEDTRLFIAAREFATNSGPIDALGFDARGNIYVVETKLYKNPDKRTVVAQALDYGASLWRHSTDFNIFIAQLDKHCQKQFGTSFSEQYSSFFNIEDTNECMSAIQSNLASGVIKFVVLMDRLHDALRDLVVFVNQNSKFDLYAVELEFYKHAEFEIIIPKLFGAEVKKDLTKKTSSSTWSWEDENEQQFLNRLNEAGRDAQPAPVERIKSTYLLAKRASTLVGGACVYGHVISKTRDVGKFILNNAKGKAVFYIDTDGSCGFYMWDSESNFDAINKKIRNSLIDENLFGKATASKEASQTLFNVKSGSDAEFKRFLAIFSSLIEIK